MSRFRPRDLASSSRNKADRPSRRSCSRSCRISKSLNLCWSTTIRNNRRGKSRHLVNDSDLHRLLHQPQGFKYCLQNQVEEKPISNLRYSLKNNSGLSTFKLSMYFWVPTKFFFIYSNVITFGPRETNSIKTDDNINRSDSLVDWLWNRGDTLEFLRKIENIE